MIHNVKPVPATHVVRLNTKTENMNPAELTFPGTVKEMPNGDVEFTYTNPNLKVPPVMHWSTDNTWTHFKTQTMTKDANGVWTFTLSGIEGAKPIYYRISNNQHDWIFLNGQPKIQTGPWISNVFYHGPKQEPELPGTVKEMPNGDVQITYTNPNLKVAPVFHWSTDSNWEHFKTQTMTKDANGIWTFTLSGIEGAKPIYYKISNDQHDWILLKGQPTAKTGPWISNIFHHGPKQEPELPGTVEEFHDGVVKFTYHNPTLKVAPVFHWSTDSNWKHFKTETMTKATNGDWEFTVSGIKGTQNIYYKISNDQHDWILLKGQPTAKTGPWISNVFRHSPKQDPEFPGTVTQEPNNTIKITYTNPTLKVPPVFHWSTDKTWTHFQTKTMTKNSDGTWIFILPKVTSDAPIYYKISNTQKDWIFLKGQPTIKTASWIANVFYPCITSNSKPDTNTGTTSTKPSTSTTNNSSTNNTGNMGNTNTSTSNSGNTSTSTSNSGAISSGSNVNTNSSSSSTGSVVVTTPTAGSNSTTNSGNYVPSTSASSNITSLPQTGLSSHTVEKAAMPVAGFLGLLSAIGACIFFFKRK